MTSQRLEPAALDDAEERASLTGRRVSRDGAAEPPEGQRQRVLRVGEGSGMGQTLVERVEDVHAQRVLDLHADLRRQEPQRAVDVRAEFHTLLAEPAELREAEDLEAPGVRQDGSVPGHEAMQPAHLSDHLVAGTEEEMVGVG